MWAKEAATRRSVSSPKPSPTSPSRLSSLAVRLAWRPGAGCGGFFAGDHRGSGSWSNGCSGTPKTAYSAQCGAPFGDGGGDGDTSCHVGAPGNTSYCTDSCPCTEGEGDCDHDTQCAGILACQEQGTVDRCARRTDACRDVRPTADCLRWASRGWCARDPEGMTERCCATCDASN